MKILASYNIKGGVGKTASAVNLAYLSAKSGLRTLIWDLDPQGAATFYFRVRPHVAGGGPRLLRGKRSIDDPIRASDFDLLDVLPADFSYRKNDNALPALNNGDSPLARILQPLEKDYDVLILDCAPSLSRLSEAIFAASHALLVPTIPTTLSLHTLAQLMKHLQKREGYRPRVLPFFCMVDRRKGLHRRVCEWVRGQDLGFLESSIPYSSDVERMGVHRTPLFLYAPKSPAAGAYRELFAETLARLEEVEETSIYRKSTRRELERVARASGELGRSL